MNLPATIDGLEEAALPNERPLHLAIGMFDGVHRGHQSVIRHAIQSARADHGLAAVLTFWPHPSVLFRPEQAVLQIMPPELKKQVLRSLGIDLVIQQPFTPAFASIPADALVAHLKTHLPSLVSIYVGENWRFGQGRTGDVQLLAQLGQALGVRVNSAPRLQHQGEAISSTRIRNCLTEGDMTSANDLLGYTYFSEGTIQKGQQLGRTLGFPTLNLPWSPPLKPRFGVYAVRVTDPADSTDHARPVSGVANYGVRPTVESLSNTPAPLLEVFLLGDRCPWQTGDRIHVEWLDFIRPEQRFAGIDDLKAQIARDVETARHVLAANP